MTQVYGTTDELVFIYFFYGLAFFTMGIAVALKYKKQSQLKLAGALPLLAAFGISHGLHEWLQLFVLVRTDLSAGTIFILKFFEIFLVTVSFLFLFQFGIKLILSIYQKDFWIDWLPTAFFSIWLIAVISGILAGSTNLLTNGDIWARYFLGFPGAALAAYALILHSSEAKALGMPHIPKNLIYAGIPMAFYSVLTGLVVPMASYFPASVINYESFAAVVGIPVYVFRGICAIGVTYFIIKTLDVFDFETGKRVDTLLAQTQKSERELLLLQKINNLLNAGAAQDEIFKAITEGLTSTYNYDSCAVHLLSKDGKKLVSRSYSMDSKIVRKIERLTGLSALGYEMPLHEGSPLTKIIETKEPLITDDIAALIESHTDKKHLRMLAKPIAKIIGTKSGIGVPLMAGDKVVGVIGIGSKTQLTGEDGERLANFAKQAGLAVEKARLEEELKVYSEHLERMVEERTRELKKSQQQLMQTEKLAATGKLAASIAHEINNPLFGIKNCIYLLMDELKSSPSRKYLNMADRELDRIANIVRQLLDFYRPSIDARVPTDVNNVVEDVLVFVENQLAKNKIAVSKELDADIPRISASPEQLKQVFLNIIINAQEAMPNGGELKIKTGVQDKSVEIEFADTGCGIPKDAIEHIFDPFFSTKKEGKGTGLGLSVSYGIIQAHSGRIDVKSKVGEGSTFTVVLPILSTSASSFPQ